MASLYSFYCYHGIMNKAGLRRAYDEASGEFSDGRLGTTEYACRLDSILREYLGLPIADLVEETA